MPSKKAAAGNGDNDSDGEPSGEMGRFEHFLRFPGDDRGCMSCLRVANKAFRPKGKELYDLGCAFGPGSVRCFSCALRNATCSPPSGLMAGDFNDLYQVISWYNKVVIGRVDGVPVAGNNVPAVADDDDENQWVYPLEARRIVGVSLRTLVLAYENIEKMHRARFALTGKQDMASFAEYVRQVEERRRTVIAIDPHPLCANDCFPRLLVGDLHEPALTIARRAFFTDVSMAVRFNMAEESRDAFLKDLPHIFED